MRVTNSHDRYGTRMRLVMTLATVSVALLLLSATPADAVGGEGETWPAFTESSACGAQRIPTPHAPRTGWLPLDTILRGDYGAYFGRTARDVHRNLVRFNVPGSDITVGVHPWMVPALETAHTSILDKAEVEGRYQILWNSTGSAATRTIGGSIRISRHAYGVAMDINARRNPFRGDNRLITDFPDWWVDSMLDAGFCWGGLWVGSKDTMHWAWQGPAFSGYTELPTPYEPLTDRTDLGYPVRIMNIDRPHESTFATVLADTSENGALDVVRLRVSGTDLVIDSSWASRRHNACSVRVSVVPDLGPVADGAVAFGFGDWDGRGGNDLWFAEDDDGALRLTVRWAYGGYTAEVASLTEVPTPGPGAWVSTGDFDVDGDLDLVVIDDGIMTVWDVDSDTGVTSVQTKVSLPFSSGAYTFGDVDIDNAPDVWNLDGDTLRIATAADGWETVSDTQTVGGVPDTIVDLDASDYDGDGRPDLVLFDGYKKVVWLGNTPLSDGQAPEVWFEAEDTSCDRVTDPVDRDELRFTSGGWVAEGSYEWRLEHGYEVGCNPEDDECEPPISTHRAVAEFFAWVENLEPVGRDPSTAAARAISAAGYDLWCPIRDDECWSSPIEATELSARFALFLHQRRDTGVEPHRWIIPVAARPAPSPVPR